MKPSAEFILNTLRDEQLRKIFLRKLDLLDGQIDIQKIISNKNIEQILTQVFFSEYLDFTFEYPHPINPLGQVMNPIKIVGVRGAYVVEEDYVGINPKWNFFTTKRNAILYANEAFEVFIDKNNLREKAKGLKPYRN